MKLVSVLVLLLPCVSCLRLTLSEEDWIKIQKQMQHTLSPNSTEDEAVREIYQNYPEILEFGDTNSSREPLDDMMKDTAAALDGDRPYVVMEIGVYLGMSMARWLHVHPNIAVVGVDPFKLPRSTSKEVDSIPDNLKQYFDQEGFRRRLTEHVIGQHNPGREAKWALIEGFSPTAAIPVLNAGMIDAFYLDGGKVENTTKFTIYMDESLHTFYAHNPDALFSGDDWSHIRTPTLQKCLKTFAAEKGLQLARSDDRTWMMGKNLAKLNAAKKHHLIWEIRDPSTYKGPTFPEIIESTKIGSESIMAPEA